MFWPSGLLRLRALQLIKPVAVCALWGLALCQIVMAQNQLPYMTGGRDSAFAQIDFAQVYHEDDAWLGTNVPGSNLDDSFAGERIVSVLDMEAPAAATRQFERAIVYMRSQDFKEAIPLLEKAIKLYPKFVSAHNALGLAYLDQRDPRAKTEFEIASHLDNNFACAFVNLGVLALWNDDFPTAESDLTTAAYISPKDPKILFALAFAQNGNGKYADALKTVNVVHGLNHRGLAGIHYIGASAAMSLGDSEAMRNELKRFLREDPANPLAPIAKEKLAAGMNHSFQQPQEHKSENKAVATTVTATQGFPNTPRLSEELNSMKDFSDLGECENCNPSPDVAVLASDSFPAQPLTAVSKGNRSGLFTIRKSVDETALFFSVSRHGRRIDDLLDSDVKILDDNNPPQRILQFSPQAELPLRLGFLIDVSGSVADRFSFEQQAAENFLERILNPRSDLAFIAGFSENSSVTQDFTANPEALREGIDHIHDGQGGTSLFDAIYFACWKLAAFPDNDRVAKVLIVLTDGQDNSSHRSLRQTIEAAEASGVTIYTLSTASDFAGTSDADRVLKMFAERTGGEAIFPGNLHNLTHFLDKISDAIRSRYLIAYRPANFAANGKYRTVKIKVRKDGKNLHVHARGGYYARVVSARY